MEITTTQNFILVDDFFENDELEKIHNELEYLKTQADFADRLSRNGKPLQEKKLSGYIALDDFYKDKREQSTILQIISQFWGNDGRYAKIMNTQTPHIFKLPLFTQHDSTEFQVYLQNGRYFLHTDDMTTGEYVVIDLLFNKEPKGFTGGDLVLDGQTIEQKNNRMVIFPAFIPHEVTEVNITSDDEMDGRISIQIRSRP